MTSYPTPATAAGYATAGYAQALTAIGRPVLLSRSGGWLLERKIAGTPYGDAVGPYPLFACRDWAGLADDLAERDRDWVSVGLVTDPFGDIREVDLRRAFPDRVVPFKQHYVVDLQRVSSATIHSHHRRNARRARARLTVERCLDTLSYLNDWEVLYQVLRDRHQIQGMAVFSRRSFAMQLALPNLVAYRATVDGKTVGMVLWLIGDDVAYYHLGAYDPLGYELHASFALFQAAIEDFAGQLRWLCLGAGAGLHGDDSDGLSRFKAGWATDRRPVYFCGRIGQPERYADLSVGVPETSHYFPAYRASEIRSR